MADYGVILTRSYRTMKTELPLILEDMANQLSFTMREMISGLYEELIGLNNRINKIEQRIESIANLNEDHQRLMAIPGIGLLTASALITQIGDAKHFSSARGLAAWLGLTPKHQASGNKIVNQGMSKRGDRYIRTLLTHGARIIVCRYTQDNALKRFADRITETRGKHKATIAVAHKMARIVWAVMTKKQPYNPNHNLTME